MPLQETVFPLATQITIGPVLPIKEQLLASRPDVSREVGVTVIHNEQACLDTMLTAVSQGQCVVWIRNTVNDALAGYELIKNAIENPQDCLLFHSRFILHDRKVIEDQVLDTFGKLSDGDKRRGTRC